MDFDLTDDQQSLQQVVRQVLRERADAAALHAAIADGAHWDDTLWHTLAADLGVVGLTIPEALGGAGAGLIELVVVQEALGERLALVPFLAVALGIEAVQACASEAQQEAWLPEMTSGGRRPVLALAEGDEAWCVAHTTVRATKGLGGWHLSGAKEHVVALEAATEFLIPANSDSGVHLFRVPREAAGLDTRPDAVLDPTRPTGSLHLTDAPGELVGGQGANVGHALERVRLMAALLLAAESVGGMQRCVDLATEQARSRVQFDRPIGGFQAVKHRCADMYVDLDSARALMRYAAWSMEASEPTSALDVRLSHGFTAEAYYRVAKENIQVQGGIGFTWEHEAHFFLKRALSARQLIGTPAQMREDSARLLGLIA